MSNKTANRRYFTLNISNWKPKEISKDEFQSFINCADIDTLFTTRFVVLNDNHSVYDFGTPLLSERNGKFVVYCWSYLRGDVRGELIFEFENFEEALLKLFVELEFDYYEKRIEGLLGL